MNTNTNNEVDYKMTPPPLPIILKKKSKETKLMIEEDKRGQQIRREEKKAKKAEEKAEKAEIKLMIKEGNRGKQLRREENEAKENIQMTKEDINVIIDTPIASVEEMAKWAEEDAKQVEIDDAQARARGYIPIDNEGDIRWVKKSLTIGEELPSEVLEAEVLPVKFADASCQTDDLLENEIVCSKCCVPKLDRKEYHKQYNEKNKEKISEYKKKYRQENKDKINTDAKRAYQKEYDAKNKEKIMARRNVILKCECGEEVKASSLAKHKKTKTHSLKVELRIAKGEIITPVEAELDADYDP